MGPVRLQYVISFSSQDEKNPVENLLNKTGQPTGKGWLSATTDRSGLLEAEFQLEKASYIHYIDIGNCGSSTIEIAVGRSSWPRSRKYISLLPAVPMMTYYESRNGINRISVRMFTSDDLNSEAVKVKWDRIRVLCSQPYRKDVQFGISFLRLGNKETDSDSSASSSNSLRESIQKKFSEKISANGSLLKRLPSSTSLSRGHTMLNAAMTMKSQERQHSMHFNSDFDYSSFEMDALIFLTSKENGPLFDSFDECLLEYEEANGVELTFPQVRIFQQLYESVFSCNGQMSVEPIPIQHSGMPLEAFYSSSSRVKRKRNEVENVSFDEDEGQLTFDLEFEPKKCNGQSFSKSVHNGHFHDEEDDEDEDDFPIVELDCPVKRKKPKSCYSENNNSTLPLITIEDETDNSSPSHTEQSNDDFVQFDGSKPGPSKEVIYVECPICGDPFHVQEIERHASTCEKYNSDDSKNENPGSKASSSSNIVPSVNCHPENYLECPVCGNMFQKTALPSHANVCIENCRA